MNIAFLVFRNPKTGYGHYYRSIALADYLKSRHHKITIIGDYQSHEYVDYNSLITETHTPIMSTLYDHIIEPWYDWLIIDLPFELSKGFYLACKEKRVKTLILNGVGHQVGDLADLRIVQGIDKEAEYSGPDYVIMRPIIQKLREDYLSIQYLAKSTAIDKVMTRDGHEIDLNAKSKWFVFGGGYDVLGLRDKFIDRWITDDFVSPTHNDNFLGYALDCDRACLAMGMTVWELLTIGLKCYVFSLTEKHLEFAMRMSELGLIKAYPKVGLPEIKDEFSEFLRSEFVPNSELVPDGRACERIERLMLSNGQYSNMDSWKYK